MRDYETCYLAFDKNKSLRYFFKIIMLKMKNWFIALDETDKNNKRVIIFKRYK